MIHTIRIVCSLEFHRSEAAEEVMPTNTPKPARKVKTKHSHSKAKHFGPFWLFGSVLTFKGLFWCFFGLFCIFFVWAVLAFWVRFGQKAG
jgi:hypothetical protein